MILQTAMEEAATGNAPSPSGMEVLEQTLQKAGWTDRLSELAAQGFKVETHRFGGEEKPTEMTWVSKGGASFNLSASHTDNALKLNVTRTDRGSCRQVSETLTEAWMPVAMPMKDIKQAMGELAQWQEDNKDRFAQDSDHQVQSASQPQRKSFLQRMLGG